MTCMYRDELSPTLKIVEVYGDRRENKHVHVTWYRYHSREP